MKINQFQIQTLQKLSEAVNEERCITKDDLIISVFLPDFWDAGFDDESLYYRRTPEYRAAEKAYSQSMKQLIYAGFVEAEGCEIDTDRDSPPAKTCYHITGYGRQALEMFK
jgi:hypothetical protein